MWAFYGLLSFSAGWAFFYLIGFVESYVKQQGGIIALLANTFAGALILVGIRWGAIKIWGIIRPPDKTKALMVAVDCGDIEEIKELVRKGVDVNAKNKNGRTALMVAVSKKQTSVVRELLNKGADVNARDKDDYQTALMVAAITEHIGVIRMLLEAGANKEATDRNDNTAFDLYNDLNDVQKSQQPAFKEISDLLRP